MMRTRTLTTLALTVPLLVACGGGGDQDAEDLVTEELPTLTTDAFSMLYPEDYEEQSQDAGGVSTTLYKAEYEGDVLVAAWSEFEGAAGSVPPESVIEGNFAAAGGEATEVIDIEVDGMPAKQAYGVVENNGKTGTTWLTLVITDNGFFQYQYAVKEERESSELPEAYEEIRDSIDLTP